MTPEKPQLKNQITNKALARVEKAVPEKDLSLSSEEIASSPWYRLARFFNESAKEVTPRNEDSKRYQNFVAPVHQKCIQVLKKVNTESWNEIINNEFEYQERRDAGEFFFFVSTRPGQKRTDAIAPKEVLQQLETDLKDFIQLAPYAFVPSENHDLVKIHALSEIMSYYQRSEKTFLFLSELPSLLDNESRQIIEASPGYQEILHWGASKFLNRLWQRLRDNFGINVNNVSEDTLYKLLRDLEDTKDYLKQQVQQLELENQDLKKTIQENQVQALQQATYKLAKTLQTQPQPVLDQIFIQSQKLNKLAESGQKLSLSETDCLGIMITFNALLTSLKDLNITPYPSNIEATFKLETQQMGEYIYVEGSSFVNSQDVKTVRCIRPGWRVGEEIVTPAPVKEITH